MKRKAGWEEVEYKKEVAERKRERRQRETSPRTRIPTRKGQREDHSRKLTLKYTETQNVRKERESERFLKRSQKDMKKQGWHKTQTKERIFIGTQKEQHILSRLEIYCQWQWFSRPQGLTQSLSIYSPFTLWIFSLLFHFDTFQCLFSYSCSSSLSLDFIHSTHDVVSFLLFPKYLSSFIHLWFLPIENRSEDVIQIYPPPQTPSSSSTALYIITVLVHWQLWVKVQILHQTDVLSFTTLEKNEPET